jgi:REP element-mobilizing transposase RayT
MPNHVHLILHLNNPANLNTIISNGKRFMAYEIIARLKFQNENSILLKLSQACTDKEKN